MTTPQVDIETIQEWINIQLNANKQMNASIGMILPIAIAKFNINADTYWKLAEKMCDHINTLEAHPFGSPLLWELVLDSKKDITKIINFIEKAPAIYKEKIALGFARLWRQNNWILNKNEYSKLRNIVEARNLPWISIQPENFKTDAYKLVLEDILTLENETSYTKTPKFKWSAGKKKIYDSLPIKNWPTISKYEKQTNYTYYAERALEQLKQGILPYNDFEKYIFPNFRNISRQTARDIVILIINNPDYINLFHKDFYSKNPMTMEYAKYYMQSETIGNNIINDSRFNPSNPVLALNNYIDDHRFYYYLKKYIEQETNTKFYKNPYHIWIESNIYGVEKLKPYILTSLYYDLYVGSRTLTADQMEHIQTLLNINISTKQNIEKAFKELTTISPSVFTLCNNAYDCLKLIQDLTHNIQPTIESLPENLVSHW